MQIRHQCRKAQIRPFAVSETIQQFFWILNNLALALRNFKDPSETFFALRCDALCIESILLISAGCGLICEVRLAGEGSPAPPPPSAATDRGGGGGQDGQNGSGMVSS